MPQISPPHAPDAKPPAVRDGLLSRCRRAWKHSLRFRLLAMGLLPLLVAFPLVLVVMLAVGGHSAASLVNANLRASLAGAGNYLQQLRGETGLRVAQLAKSDLALRQALRDGDWTALDQGLRAAAQSSGLDFLLIASADGAVLASSSGVARGSKLPESYVVRQARIGIANTAYERVTAAQLDAFSPSFAAQALITADDATRSGDGLLINAAAHLPLALNLPDAILVGGILVNRKLTLIDHMRELLFPVGSLPGDVEGLTAVHLGPVKVAASRQRLQGHAGIGEVAPAEALQAVLEQGETWMGPATVAGQSHAVGFAPLLDGDGKRIGMLSVSFPDQPYKRVIWLLLASVALLLALTMLALSLVFIHSGRELTQRLAHIVQTMNQVREGRRQARVGRPQREDELGQLAQHFDELLETIAAQDSAQRAAQQTIADEASRRRALFEHERDGVVILNSDGSMFEANPKGAAMLGYSVDELLRLRVGDWEIGHDAQGRRDILAQVGSDGFFGETLLRRKDGSHFQAELALSRVAWGERSFVLLLMRDISERKAVEAELARYRQQLEHRVEQRTRELGERSEQLDAILALSPDGFVSFDRSRCVAFANQAFLRMTGLSAAEIAGLGELALSERLAGRSAADAVFPGLPALREAQLAREAAAARVGETSPGSLGDAQAALAPQRQLFELALPRRRVLEVALRLSRADRVSQVLYVRDITHENEVDRMKSEFLATAAHELRTPMTSIYGFANLLRMREASKERRDEVLGIIAQQSELMISILNELLDLARIEERRDQDFQRQRTTLKELIDETVAGYATPAGREPPRLGAIDAGLHADIDRQRMHQALLNVLSNAYKYSPGGGAVELRLRQEQRRERSCVGIEVRDHGMGMSAEQLARVGERFYRADASGNIPGTGLGMAIVSEIIGLHGGELELASEPGLGSTVTLWLPQAL